LAEQRREETVADSAGNAAADSLLWAERLMSEHDQQLQLVREDHAQEVSHLQHLAAAAAAGRQMIMMIMLFIALFRNKLRIPLGGYVLVVLLRVQLDKARKDPMSTSWKMWR